MKSIVSALLLSATLLGGCASCKSMPALRDLRQSGLINDPQQVSRLEKSLSDGEIGNLLDVGVKAKLPSAIAVAKLESRCSGYQPYICTIDAQELTAWQKAVEGQEHILGIMPVTQMAAGGDSVSLHSLRVAAAKMNCELLLVYLQSDAEVDNLNDAAVLYWTIVGLWTVPGSRMEHRTVMQAILLDCRTGIILGAATGDSHLKRTYPAAFEDQRRAELTQEAPAKAMADLQKAFAQLVKQTVTKAKAKTS